MFNKVLVANRGEVASAHHARLQGIGREDGGGLFHRRCQYGTGAIC